MPSDNYTDLLTVRQYIGITNADMLDAPSFLWYDFRRYTGQGREPIKFTTRIKTQQRLKADSYQSERKWTPREVFDNISRNYKGDFDVLPNEGYDAEN